MKRDYEAGLDGLQADMAAHQHRIGKEVTAEANRALAQDAIEKLDRQAGSTAPEPGPVAPTIPIRPEVTREQRVLGERSYVVKKDTTADGQDLLLRKATAHEAWFLAHAMPRVALLLTKPESGPLGAPSWRDRVLAAMDIHSHAASLRAAAEDPTDFARQKRAIDTMPPLEKNRVLRALDIIATSELTPAFARKKADELDRKYLVTLCAILEDSCVPFGDWKKDAPTKAVAA